MNRWTFILFALISLVASATPPYIVPLPELHGTYGSGTETTVNRNCGATFTQIYNVDLVCWGYYSRGILMDVGTGSLSYYDIPPFKFTTPLVSEDFKIEYQPYAGNFWFLDTFWPASPQANWDFMLNGQIEIRAKIPWIAIPAIYTVIKPAQATITEACLEIWATAELIEVQNPNQHQYLLAGSTCRITWFDYRDISTAEYLLSFSLDNGQNWQPITPNPITGWYYDWQVPLAIAENCLVKVEDADTLLSDTSDEPFGIYECITPPPNDYTNDCYVNLRDFRILASGWLLSEGYDLNDLLNFAENWLNCSNPIDPTCGI